MGDSGFSENSIPLGEALSRLPLEAPDRSAWPVLSARLSAGRHRSRWPYALAASLLALLLLPRGLPTPSAEQASSFGSNTTSQQVELAALMSESSRLERLVASAADDGASSATAAALGLELEDRLHVLDGELEANRDPSRQLNLWQQRVQLLRNVAVLETSRHYLAAEGRNFDVALVSTY
jgi:hypothetical protein